MAVRDGETGGRLRAVRYLVPDVRGAEFAAEAHRQARAVAQSGSSNHDQDFVEEISVDWGEE